MNAIRVLVVDDHDLFRRGLTEVLDEEDDMRVVGEARDGREAIARTAELAPDVVCMDLNMPGRGGIEATALLTQRWPEIKVLVLTVSEEPEDLYRALGVGALGYTLKNARPRDIVEALRQVSQGWVVVSLAIASRMLSDMRGPVELNEDDYLLADAELEVLELVTRGESSADIAHTLAVPEDNVKTHIKGIVHKLHARHRSEAEVYASRLSELVDGIGSEVESAYHVMRDYLGESGGRAPETDRGG